MLLIFAFILLGIGVGILVSIYSIFLPFIKNLGEIGDYNTAYYAAISSIERGELVLKYRQPGFEGSGWYNSGTNWGPQSDYKTWAFGFINANTNNGMRWSISSRTTNIPNTGHGNIEYLLADQTSADYNTLNYSSAEKIILSYDSTNDVQQYYTAGENIVYYTGGTLEWKLRLPPKVLSWFGWALLCTYCDADQDGVWDDIVVDRSLEGQKNMYFKILPNISILYYSGLHVNENQDIAIRESIINMTGDIDFEQFDPIKNHSSSSLSGHVVIANDPSSINTNYFSTILWNNNTYTGLTLNIWLINLLTTSNGDIYPFLEYQFSVSSPVADRFYNIQGNGHIGEYDVQITVKKPTSQWSIAWSFTVIF